MDSDSEIVRRRIGPSEESQISSNVEPHNIILRSLGRQSKPSNDAPTNWSKWRRRKGRPYPTTHESWAVHHRSRGPQQQNVQYRQKLKPIPHRKYVILISFQHNSYIILWHTSPMAIYRWSGVPNSFQQHSDFIDDHSTFFPWHWHTRSMVIYWGPSVSKSFWPTVTSLYCHSSTSFYVQHM